MRDPTLGCSSFCHTVSPGENLGSRLPASQGTAWWVSRCQSPSDLGRRWHRGWCWVAFSVVAKMPRPGLAGRLGVNLWGAPSAPSSVPVCKATEEVERGGSCRVFGRWASIASPVSGWDRWSPKSPCYWATKPCRSAWNCIPLVLPGAVFIHFSPLLSPARQASPPVVPPFSPPLQISTSPPTLFSFSTSSLTSMHKNNNNKKNYPGFLHHKAASEVNRATCKRVLRPCRAPHRGTRPKNPLGLARADLSMSFQAEIQRIWGLGGGKSPPEEKRKQSMCCRRERQCHRRADTAI